MTRSTGTRILLSLLAAAALGGAAPAARADEAPTKEQIAQLQKQLDDLQKELEGMRSALQAGGGKGDSAQMRTHMHGMGMHWKSMRQQYCAMGAGMDPESCPAHMKMGMEGKPPEKK